MTTIEYLRSFRIMNFAIFDFVGALIFAVVVGSIISRLLRKVRISIPMWSWILWAIPIGVFAHWVFGVETPLNEILMDPNAGLQAKVIIGGLLLSGFTGIRIGKDWV